MTDLPTVMTAAGLQPQSPAALLVQLITAVAAVNPGYTASLPGGLIEDVSSTEVGGIALCDSARVELVNSLTPYGANAFLLNQLGQIYGVPLGAPSNTSVFLIFTGPPGFVVAQGFTVSDGNYQYVVQDGGVIGSDNLTAQLFAVATVFGSWAVPAGTVTELITSVPGTISLSVTNPQPGTPSTAAETQTSYRSRILQAGLAASQGMGRYLKTLLGKVAGVAPRLVSVRQVADNGGWEILVGGGDPYQVGYAILTSLFDVNTLVGSTLRVTGITAANPGVVTTDLNHGFVTGRVINVTGIVGPTTLNNTPLTIAVITEKTFSIGIDTSGLPAYVSGGVVTPNLRNISVSLNDYPNTYLIPYVNPPQQTVAITVTWNTTATNFVSAAAIAQLGSPALVAYVNALAVGVPMNLYELQAVFQAAVASVLPPQLLTRMVFSVSINGSGVSPEMGTGIIAGDPESYFETDSTQITITQG